MDYNIKMNIDSEFKENFLNGINDFKDIGINIYRMKNVHLYQKIFKNKQTF